MIHQGSAGFQGTAADIEVQAREILRIQKRMEEIYAFHTTKDIESIRRDLSRDFWLGAQETVEYGIADQVVGVPAAGEGLTDTPPSTNPARAPTARTGRPARRAQARRRGRSFGLGRGPVGRLTPGPFLCSDRSRLWASASLARATRPLRVQVSTARASAASMGVADFDVEQRDGAVVARVADAEARREAGSWSTGCQNAPVLGGAGLMGTGRG